MPGETFFLVSVGQDSRKTSREVESTVHSVPINASASKERARWIGRKAGRPGKRRRRDGGKYLESKEKAARHKAASQPACVRVLVILLRSRPRMFDNRKTFTFRTALHSRSPWPRIARVPRARGSLDLDLSIGPRYVRTPPKMSRANGFLEFHVISVFRISVCACVISVYSVTPNMAQFPIWNTAVFRKMTC